MSVRKLKPITPGQRFRIVNEYSEVTTSKPEKSLLKPMKKSGGRNNQGRMTMRYKGGGHKKRYRVIDFKRNIGKYSLLYNLYKEYDPNRKTNISRVYTNKFKCFYINSSGSNNNIFINKYTNIDNKSFLNNDNYKLKYIPLGYKIFNIQPKNLIKAPGTYGTIISKTDKIAKVKLPSKKIIELNINNTANIGRNDNINHNLTNFGKAGAKR